MVAKGEIQLTTVLDGNIGGIDEGLQRWEQIARGEDKNLGRGDGIEPLLDPTPNRREEGWRPDNLNRHIQTRHARHKDRKLTKMRSSVSG